MVDNQHIGFVKKKKLGETNFYTVDLCVDETDKSFVVLKRHRLLRLESIRNFQNECRARLLLSSSSRTVPLRVVDEVNGIIVQDYMSNGSLKKLISVRGKLSQLEIRFYLSKIIEALLQLERYGIYKCSLELKDILLDMDLKPKLTNFYKSNFDQTSEFIPGIQIVAQNQQRRSHLQLIEKLANQLFSRWNLDVRGRLKQISESFNKQEQDFMRAINSGKYSLSELLIHPLIHRESLVPSKLPLTLKQCGPSSKFIEEYVNLGQFNRNLEAQWSRQMKRLMEVEVGQKNMKGLKGFQSVLQSRILVKQFIDLSYLYGYGYKFSNRNVGFTFNDNTILLMELAKKTYLFRAYDKTLFHYSFDGIIDNDQLKKKILFLNAFANELPAGFGPKDSTASDQSIFITKYVKTKHANLLRFSSDAVHAFFSDKTQVYIDKDLRFYLDKHQKQFVFKKGLSHPEDIEAKLEYVQKMSKTFFSKGIISRFD